MLRSLRIGRRLYLIVLVPVVALALVAVTALLGLRWQLMDQRQQQARERVGMAVGLLAHFHHLAATGAMSDEEARSQALAGILSMRRDRRNYVWINDLTPIMIAHPEAPELVGHDLSSVVDPEGRPLFQDFLRQARQGGGFSSYLWPPPGSREPVPKISYVQLFEPWGWIVGSGLYVDDIAGLFRSRTAQFGMVVMVAAVFAGLLIWAIGNSITRPLALVTRKMAKLADGGETAVAGRADRHDEISDLVHAMTVFKRNLAQMEEVRQARQEEMRIAGTVFNVMNEAVVVTGADNRVKAVNPAFTRVTGYRPEDILGRDPKMLSSGRHGPDFYKSMWGRLHDAGGWDGEIWNRRKSGETYVEWLSIRALRDQTGAIHEYVGIFSDITDRKRQELKIRWQAEHDALTLLPNRRCFEDRLRRAVAEAGAADTVRLALLFIDLDRFKVVNDTLGHAVGDILLQEMARRLRLCVRASDTVARLGGDEFTVILNPLSRREDAVAVAGKIVSELSRPLTVGERVLQVGASVGVAFLPDDAGTVEDLLLKADDAMYRAKEGGRCRFCLCDGVVEPPQSKGEAVNPALTIPSVA